MRINNTNAVTNRKQTFGMSFLPTKNTAGINAAEKRALEKLQRDSDLTPMAREFDVQVSRWIRVDLPNVDSFTLYPHTKEGQNQADSWLHSLLRLDPATRFDITHHHKITVSKAGKSFLEKAKSAFSPEAIGTALSEGRTGPFKPIVSSDPLVYQLEELGRDALYDYTKSHKLKPKERDAAAKLAEKHLADPCWQAKQALRARVERIRAGL